MTTYQTLTFGANGGAGTITQVSEQEFFERYGDPWAAVDKWVNSYDYYDYVDTPVGDWEPAYSYVPPVFVPDAKEQYVPPAPSKIFDAKTSDYDIVPGKQQGALNDPRTVQGADGYFYTVTRTGTDKYDISRIDSPAAITVPTENTIVFSPVKDVQVAVQAKQGSSVPVQRIKSDNQGSETFI